MSDQGHLARWRAVAQGEFAWANEGEAPVLYHRRSGCTHFVNVATALLLQEILLEPKDAGEAAAALAAAQAAPGEATPGEVPPEESGLPGQVQAILLRLEELGLVERVPQP